MSAPPLCADRSPFRFAVSTRGPRARAGPPVEEGQPPARGRTRMSTVLFDTDGEVAVVAINRPEVRNAVDDPTAAALVEAFRRFDADEGLAVAVLTGAGGTFCAGADLKAVASGQLRRGAAGGGNGPGGGGGGGGRGRSAGGGQPAWSSGGGRATPRWSWPISSPGSRSAASAPTACPPTNSGGCRSSRRCGTSSGAAPT